jgi:TIR domain-containing protein
MADSTYDLFLSHSGKDTLFVRGIANALTARGVHVWFDEVEIVAGDRIVRSMERGLEESRATAVFLGPGGFGAWHDAEAEAAIHQQVERGGRVIPVLLPGVPADKPPLPSFLAVRKRVEFRRPDDADALDALVRALKRDEPQPEPTPVRPAAAQPDRAAEDAAFDRAVNQIVSTIRRTGSLTLFVGRRAAPDRLDLPPGPYEIARELLTELKLIPADYQALLPSLDTASTYYEVKEGPTSLEDRVVGLITARARAVSPLHERLAALVQQMNRPRGKLRRPQGPAEPTLIVTTSLDLMCERALLRAGVSFTRVVQHWSGNELAINQYRNVSVAADGILSLQNGTDVMQVDPANFDDLDYAITNVGATTIPPRGTQATQGGPIHPIRDVSLAEFQPPLLYKYHGSHDVSRSCALSTDHYLRLAARAAVPDGIVKIIGNSSALFLVSGALDSDVRHAYQTLIRRAYEVDDAGFARVAVVCPLRDPEGDGYRRSEMSMWDRAKDRVREQMRINVVEGDAQEFLNRVLSRLDEGAALAR